MPESYPTDTEFYRSTGTYPFSERAFQVASSQGKGQVGRMRKVEAGYQNGRSAEYQRVLFAIRAPLESI